MKNHAKPLKQLIQIIRKKLPIEVLDLASSSSFKFLLARLMLRRALRAVVPFESSALFPITDLIEESDFLFLIEFFCFFSTNLASFQKAKHHILNVSFLLGAPTIIALVIVLSDVNYQLLRALIFANCKRTYFSYRQLSVLYKIKACLFQSY